MKMDHELMLKILSTIEENESHYMTTRDITGELDLESQKENELVGHVKLLNDSKLIELVGGACRLTLKGYKHLEELRRNGTEVGFFNVI